MAGVIEQQAVCDDEKMFAELSASRKPPLSTSRLTFEQARKVAAGASFELIDGKIVLKGAEDKHADAHGLLCGLLGQYFKTKPMGRVRLSFTLRLPPDNPYEARTPDLSVILNENLREEDYGSRAPDIAIEILSRSDDRNALFEKAKLYLDNGSRVVWIVDPYQKGVMVITPNSRHWITDTLTCPELLPGFSVNMQDIFAWPAAPIKAAE
jgi:Uma2 family endonuclease